MGRSILLAAFISLLTGCAGWPFASRPDWSEIYTPPAGTYLVEPTKPDIDHFDMDGPDGLRAKDLTELCLMYGEMREGFIGKIWRKYLKLTPKSQAQIEEVIIEKGLPKKDLDYARERKVAIGMSLNGLYASRGPGDENKTVGPWGVHIQHVYGGGYGPYFYTKNGVVSSWQSSRSAFLR